MTTRVPTMKDSLLSLLEKGVPVDVVLDVGILTGTQPLIEVFGDREQHLFEPVDLHFDKINKNYRNIKHRLHHVALSDSEGEAYLPCWAIHGDGVITHSEVSAKPITKADMPNLVECKTVRKTTLDTVCKEIGLKENALLKIDVDGHEMSILSGAVDTLKKTSIVVIEAPLNKVSLPHFFQRAGFLMEQGFYMVDIVDFAYYDGVLWQVDLVFVNKKHVTSIGSLKPFESENFKFEGEKWYPLSDPTYVNRFKPS